MIPNPLKKSLPWLLALAVFILLLYANKYIELTYTVSSKGLLYPGKEWVLSRTTDGNLINSLKDNFNNSLIDYTVTEFQRGDMASFAVRPQVLQKKQIEKGDTIAIIQSQNELLRITELRGELAVQQRLLSVYASGERLQDIEVAYQQMILAQNEVKAQQRITERNRILYEKRHIPEEEYEVSLNELNIKEQEYLIAQTQYESLKGGAKPEQIELIQANIESLKQQIEQINRLMDAYTITSPINGIIIKQQGTNTSYETILRVAQTTEYVIKIPVNVYQLPYLETGQKLNFHTPGTGEAFSAYIAGFDNTVQMIDGRQKIFLTAVTDLPANEFQFFSNTLVDVSIPSAPVSLGNYLKRLVNEVYNN